MATGYEVQMYRHIQIIAESLQRIATALEKPVAEPVANDLTELREAVSAAEDAAEGDSNDTEIEALQGALETALSLVPGWNGEPRWTGA